jgi:peptidoglycan/xylan/chitin deacetylase (PgdA/CDA1 family)
MVHRHEQTTPRRIYLTFDDGPSAETTPQLLDHLKEAGIKATFFVVGRNIENASGRAIVERMAAEGHQIGNHTYSHPNLTRLDAAVIGQEIKQTEDLIGPLDNGIKVFRPPFGFHNGVHGRTRGHRSRPRHYTFDRRACNGVRHGNPRLARHRVCPGRVRSFSPFG